MTDVIGVLRREHANMAALLDTLEAELAELERAGSPDYDVIRGVINYFLSFPDIYHHPKENLIFARLVERDPRAAACIGDLRIEHERLSARSREFGAGLEAVNADEHTAAPSFLRWGHGFVVLQRQHMVMEEELFLPTAERVLNEADWLELHAAMTDHDDPLLGEAVGAHFETIRARILSWQRRGAPT